ncbi:MAG: hypothetical protein HQL26_00545 [Candidatus Omnitrophica bacterium]|nr:hypothetical protein [Candidatus Omnitrophota bacterium]
MQLGQSNFRVLVIIPLIVLFTSTAFSAEVYYLGSNSSRSSSAVNPGFSAKQRVNDLFKSLYSVQKNNNSSGYIGGNFSQSVSWNNFNLTWPFHMPGLKGFEKNGSAQIQLSASTFESLNTAPTGGYGASGTIPADADGVGKVFVFITKEGYYGKLKTTANPGAANTADPVIFDYVVQTNGTTNLATQ